MNSSFYEWKMPFIVDYWGFHPSISTTSLDTLWSLMTETPTRKAPEDTIHPAFIHDFRNTLFGKQFTPCCSNNIGATGSDFEQICRRLSEDCETLSALIEGEYGKKG